MIFVWTIFEIWNLETFYGFYYFETPEVHNRLMAEIRWSFWTETRNWSETAPWLMWLTNPPSRTKRTRERTVEKTADVSWPTFISNRDTNCKRKYQYFGNPSLLTKWDSLIRDYIILFGSTIPRLIYDLILTHSPGEDEYVLLSHKNGDRHFCQPDSIGTGFLTLGEWQLCPCVSPGPNMDTAKVHAGLMMGPVVSMAQNDSRITVVTVLVAQQKIVDPKNNPHCHWNQKVGWIARGFPQQGFGLLASYYNIFFQLKKRFPIFNHLFDCIWIYLALFEFICCGTSLGLSSNT